MFDKSTHLLVCGMGAGMDRSLPEVADMGLSLHVVMKRPSPIAIAAADTVLAADPDDHAKVCTALRRAGITHLDGILSLGEDNTAVIARLAREYNCPGVDERVAWNCTRKDRRIALLAAAGLDTPRYAVADSDEQALRALHEVGLPSVVKPCDRSESIGVVKVQDWTQAPARVRQALAQSVAGPVVVESFLTGSEHTVTGVVQDDMLHVVVFSDREYTTKEQFSPFFFEAGDTFPTALSATEVAEIIDVVRDGLKALELHSSIFNCDVLRTDDGRIVLLELTCRMAGARIPTELALLASGVNIVRPAVELSLGRTVDATALVPTRNRAVVQRYVPTNNQTVQWRGSLAEISQREGVYDVYWGVQPVPGQPLPPYRPGQDVLAGVIAHADTVAAAEAIAARAIADLPLVLTPPDQPHERDTS
jgi:biotin carboxylase